MNPYPSNEKQLNSEQQEGESQPISSSEEESDYRQQQAFLIPELDENNIEPDELEAYQYLISVRNQATTIKNKNKQQKMAMKRKQKLAGQTEAANNPIVEKIQNNQQQLRWFQAWKQEVLQNWRCVVENFKYLHKHGNTIGSADSTKPKLSPVLLLGQKPVISNLADWSLDAIEQLLAALSEQEFYGKSKYYYLWVYSLLAAHRALASYQIFQTLADVNACIAASTQSQIQTGDTECLVVSCIMEAQFRQSGLKNMYPKLIQRISRVE